jgi:hypothetical protein
MDGVFGSKSGTRTIVMTAGQLYPPEMKKIPSAMMIARTDST